MGQPERDELVRGHSAPSPAEPQAAAPEPEVAVRDLASTMGNQSFSRAVAREGGGILPDGTVHPAVQRAIEIGRGAGAPLPESAQSRFGDALGGVSDVRVHADAESDALTRSVSARAFAVGTDLYFSSGAYRPGSADGDRLLAHELTHVAQQRGAPSSGPLQVSQPGDAQEREADAAAQAMTDGSG